MVMADLGNSCQFIGNLGNDPELTYLQDGTARARFRLAVNDRKRNPQDGTQTESTFWVSVTALGKQAELVTERLHKGSRVLTRGRLEPREWTGNDGQKRFSLDLLQRDFEFFDGRRDAGVESGGTDPQPTSVPVEESDLPF
jgi:single-strand DNA-binding protein